MNKTGYSTTFFIIIFEIKSDKRFNNYLLKNILNSIFVNSNLTDYLKLLCINLILT